MSDYNDNLVGNIDHLETHILHAFKGPENFYNMIITKVNAQIEFMREECRKGKRKDVDYLNKYLVNNFDV